MSYTVLARKYRSATLDDLVGQRAIATTLKNAIASDRVHHGYLFTGTRGVGKTSTARVLAKCLNCQAGDAPTATPCGQCESCRMIAEGEDIDVIEIDAASNTGVDNIRDLRDNAAYRPARARFKVYIIDEVHMLSTGAFNALLKTLEEPPGHVKFILATTEVHKVPATIVSRCQRFDFRTISVDDIAAHLHAILHAENVQAEESVVRRVARLANGSMRDALSLLDQLLSFGGGMLSQDVLEDVLPAPHDEVIAAMVDAVADEDAAAALGCVERALSGGQTIARLCELTVEHLRMLMLMNVCGAETDLVDLPESVRQRLAEQSQRFDAPTYVYMISLMEEVRRAARSSAASRALVDAAVVRMAMAVNFSDVGELLKRLDGPGGEPTGGAGAGGRTSRAKRSSGQRGASKSAAAAPPRTSGSSQASATAPSVQAAPGPSNAAGAAKASVSAIGTPSPPVSPAATAPRTSASAASAAAGTVRQSSQRSLAGRGPSARGGTTGAGTTFGSASAISAAERDRARRDPLVQQAVDLFEGTVVGVERAADSEPAPPNGRAGAAAVDETTDEVALDPADGPVARDGAGDN